MGVERTGCFLENRERAPVKCGPGASGCRFVTQRAGRSHVFLGSPTPVKGVRSSALFLMQVSADGSTLKSAAGSIGGGIGSATETLQDGAAAALDNAGRFGRKQANAVSDYAGSIPGAGVEMFETARSNLTELFKAQPLALGAVGLAIGAGIAAALPPSEVEAAYLGETSDTVKSKAAEFAAEQTDRATKVAEGVMGAVAEEARKQGLTIEGAKSAAAEISAKVGRVGDAAGKSISDQVTSTK